MSTARIATLTIIVAKHLRLVLFMFEIPVACFTGGSSGGPRLAEQAEKLRDNNVVGGKPGKIKMPLDGKGDNPRLLGVD